jgi:hypothetical protein
MFVEIRRASSFDVSKAAPSPRASFRLLCGTVNTEELPSRFPSPLARRQKARRIAINIARLPEPLGKVGRK